MKTKKMIIKYIVISTLVIIIVPFLYLTFMLYASDAERTTIHSVKGEYQSWRAFNKIKDGAYESAGT